MPPMRAARLVLAFGCLLAVAAGVGGCGGDSGSGSTAATAEAGKSRPAPARNTFPSPQGRSLKTLLELADAPSELMVSPAAMVFYAGENRYPFGIFEREGPEVTDAEVALYYAKVPTPPKGARSRSASQRNAEKAQVRALEEPAAGPFPARIESLTAKPAFRTPPADVPTAATVVYSTQLDFPGEGEWRIAALIREGDELSATLLPGAVVGEFRQVPRPGRKAPANGAVGARKNLDYAQALGKRPIVLLFGTPKFCQSRVCGPVVDVTEQAKHEYADKAAFIQMETYNGNDPGKGVSSQARAFHLPSEPWLFTINREGNVSAAIEGAFGAELLTEAIERVVAE